MLKRYYSLDECQNKDLIYDYLDSLADSEKIELEDWDDDVIKIKNISLTNKELKDLIKLFEDNDVLEYTDIDEDDDMDDDEDDFDWDDF